MLGMNFVFWVIVHGIADGVFKGISSIDELLEKRPPMGRESWTLKWNESVENIPFFRMVTAKGPLPDRALTFSSMRHNNTTLAEREGFKQTMRIHGIRGEVANRIDHMIPSKSTVFLLLIFLQQTHLKLHMARHLTMQTLILISSTRQS